MQAVRNWSTGVAVSLSVHVLVALLLSALLVTRDVPQAPPPELSFEVASLDVPKNKGRERAAEGDVAAQKTTQSTAANSSLVPMTQARAETPKAVVANALLAPSKSAQNVPQTGQRLESQKDRSDPIVGQPVKAEALSEGVSLPATLDSLVPRAQALQVAEGPSQAVFSTAPSAQKAAFVADPSTPLSDAKVPMKALISTSPSGSVPFAADTKGRSLGAAFAIAQSVPPVRPDSFSANTLLAWSGDLTTELRQQTLDAAAALRVESPGAQGQGIRDRLADQLNAVDCARAQTGYDPDTGAIDLRGHVKSDADRDALVAALEAGLQGALPVRDRLRRLPSPQCEVLSVMADMPLPQSVEQFTNPLIIGDDLHARVYSYAENDRIRFELSGADYPGWVYIDYYDNEGRVLHLLPNQVLDPILLDAKEPLVFGGGSVADVAKGKLELRVSPPFGEDIVVAMVTSEPLFDDDRPTTEQAAPYLDFVAQRIIELKENSREFRGEWVYLFIETSPASEAGE